MKETFKKHKYVNKNRMKFESGLKKFDDHVVYIGNGNVVSNVQHSSFIRPFNDKDNGIAPGQGRAFDIKGMDCNPNRRIPYVIMRTIDENPNDGFWLYDFHFPDGKSLGWMLVSRDSTWVVRKVVSGRWTSKRQAALDEAMKYVVKGPWN